MSKIDLHDSMMDIVTKMSEGNPGAMAFVMEVITSVEMGLIKIILPCDTIGLYGSKLYMLWNDCCNRNINEVIRVIEAWRTGKISSREILNNVSQGRGTPFLILDELDKLVAK